MQWLKPGAMEPDQIQIYALPHTDYLSLGKVPSLSGSQLPHLRNGDIHNAYLIELLLDFTCEAHITAPWSIIAIITTTTTIPATVTSFTQAAKHF